MWYVIQTVTGTEEELKEQIESIAEKEVCRECLVPLCENVWRKEGIGHISIQRLFPGYLFVDTDQPKEIYRIQKEIQRFTRMLAMPATDGERIFQPVEPEEEAFIRSLLEDGVMHVSYIRMGKNGRIDEIKGPLAEHAAFITKLDVPHRRAVVEKDLFGKRRRIKFGLWTDADPRLPWLERQTGRDLSGLKKEVSDIGIHIGDKVRSESTYGDMVMMVEAVDPARRVLRTRAELFGTDVSIEVSADAVTKV